MTRLEDTRSSRRTRLAAQWVLNMLLLTMFLLIGTVVYLASIVGHLDDRMQRLIRVDETTKTELDRHINEVDKHTDQSDFSHCALLRAHDLDAPCPGG